jgi:TPR repeat protein
MRIFRAKPLISVTAVPVLALALLAGPAFAQANTALPGDTAADAAWSMANMLDGAAGGLSSQMQLSALEEAAKAGEPSAQYQLGLMYESGEGVERDPVKAFGYFSQIANEHADTSPRGLESSIVAQSFVKVGQYYRRGLPEAGIAKDENYSNRLMMHAASYFGDAEAQYLVGLSYLEDEQIGANSLQSARWLSLAAQKGHAAAQAQLGRLLFNGEGMEADPVEGIMWLTTASRRAVNTPDQGWIDAMLRDAMSVATPEQRLKGIELADTLSPRFGGLPS